MVADIARITYDPTRQYRSLIYQQGRVTLEADNNEAAILASEALRLETLDIIGPTGALGDGFLVYTDANGYGLRKGIFYLGGWRLELDADFPLPPLKTPTEDIPNLAVAMLLTEQSVCAVEDQALREVALGGPDSAARSRLMQNFVPVKIDGTSCASGWESVVGQLKAEGVTVDAGLQLHSRARLLAGFVPGPPNKDPCTPAAAGGYLGADNQMLRVTVTGYIPRSGQKGGNGTLLWGWNNASLLYRATATNATTLDLTTLPVDQEHAPQAGQWVEVLLTELDLENGNYIAAGQGFVTYVTSGYVAAGDPVTLNDALPADYQDSKTPLFLRLWQAQVPFIDGEVTPLDNVSGINVTITMNILPPVNPDGLPLLAARPFWRFSVRPSTPTSIYPERYALTPQPPDGPRQWITDLAVLTGGTLADCRVPWPKSDASGCCGLTLDPAGVAALGGLQAVVESLAGAAAVLSLRTGTYKLPAPLLLTEKNAGLTIEGCSQNVIIEGSAPADNVQNVVGFDQGLVALQGVDRIILRQLRFNIIDFASNEPATGTVDPQNFSGLIGIRIDSSSQVTIEDCTLRLATRSEVTLGVAVAALGPAKQIVLRNNVIIATGAGFSYAVVAMDSGAQDSASMDLWEITGNEMGGLSLATFCIAQLGLINCSRNILRDCQGGFIFADVDMTSATGFTAHAMKQSGAGMNVQLGNAAYMAMRPDFLADHISKITPIFAKLTPAKTVKLSAVATRALKDQAASSGLNIYNTIATANTDKAAEVAAEKTQTDQPAALTVDPKVFDQLNKVSVTAEAYEEDITPALRFDGNEITLGGSSPAAGIAVVMSFDELGSVMVTSNRVVVPDATTSCCTLVGPTGAVVTGNMFWQKAVQPDKKAGRFSLMLIAGSTGIVSAGNVAVFAEYIAPARPAGLDTTGWDFLNSVTV